MSSFSKSERCDNFEGRSASTNQRIFAKNKNGGEMELIMSRPVAIIRHLLAIRPKLLEATRQHFWKGEL
jgi:hypothetical protein